LYQIIQIARSLGWIVYYVIAEMFGERDSSERCAAKIVDDMIHHHEKQLLQIINPLPERSLAGFNKLWEALVKTIEEHFTNTL
jgi:hypothetical protein